MDKRAGRPAVTQGEVDALFAEEPTPVVGATALQAWRIRRAMLERQLAKVSLRTITRFEAGLGTARESPEAIEFARKI